MTRFEKRPDPDLTPFSGPALYAACCSPDCLIASETDQRPLIRDVDPNLKIEALEVTEQVRTLLWSIDPLEGTS